MKRKLADYPPEIQAKARAMYAERDARRKLPGHCGRCGKPSLAKSCDACKAYHAAYREQRTRKEIVVEASHLRRIESLEMRLARLELWIEHKASIVRMIKRREAALLARKRRELRNLESMPTMSIQELTQIGHTL